MPDENGTPTLPEVMTALGCKTSDLKGLTPLDRDDLKRYLKQENELKGGAQ